MAGLGALDIPQTGFLPANGSSNNRSNGNGSSLGNGHAQNGGKGNGRTNRQRETWLCPDRQPGLITKVVDGHHLDKQDLQTLAARDRMERRIALFHAAGKGNLRLLLCSR